MNGTEHLHDRLMAAVGDRTFRRIGEMTSTHPETVRRYLSGHAPSVDFVTRLADALGLNMNWILTGRGPMCLSDVKPQALREANATDLLTHVALAIERLESRVDRLDRYTQVLEVMIRRGSGASASVEPKPSESDHGKPTETTPKGPDTRARSVADALTQRSRPDAG